MFLGFLQDFPAYWGSPSINWQHISKLIRLCVLISQFSSSFLPTGGLECAWDFWLYRRFYRKHHYFVQSPCVVNSQWYDLTPVLQSRNLSVYVYWLIPRMPLSTRDFSIFFWLSKIWFCRFECLRFVRIPTTTVTICDLYVKEDLEVILIWYWNHLDFQVVSLTDDSVQLTTWRIMFVFFIIAVIYWLIGNRSRKKTS